MQVLSSAPLAGMFVALTPLAFLYPEQSTGLPVLMARTRECVSDDFRTVVIHVLQGGKIKLNMEDSDQARLGKRLHEVFAVRAVQVVFVTGDPQLPFQEVAEVIDIATKHVDNVALLTPTLKPDLSHCLTITPWLRKPAQQFVSPPL